MKSAPGWMAFEGLTKPLSPPSFRSDVEPEHILLHDIMSNFTFSFYFINQRYDIIINVYNNNCNAFNYIRIWRTGI